MGFHIERIELLLLVAAVVSMLARRMRLPYTVGLVFAGLGISLLTLPFEISLTKALIFKAFLPPLIFEAAFLIPWRGLRRDLPVTLMLATAGVFLAAAVVSLGLYYGLHWPWQAALLFGVLISATDPVSVIATFKAAHTDERLSLLVETESLLNDGTAAVLFSVALAAVTGETAISTGGIMASFGLTVIGGLVCGLLVGAATLLCIRRTDDHLVEVTFTTIAAYGSFLLAEHFHLSGVLATLAAGLLIGNLGDFGNVTDKGRAAIESVWEYIGFTVNSLIFLMIGMPLARQNFSGDWWPLLIVISLVLAGRALAIYGCCALFMKNHTLRMSAAHQHVLFWGGLRGALALALVLGLPETIPMHDTIVKFAFGVVAFSIIVQGVTITPLLHKLGALQTKSG